MSRTTISTPLCVGGGRGELRGKGRGGGGIDERERGRESKSEGSFSQYISACSQIISFSFLTNFFSSSNTEISTEAQDVK